MPASAPYVDYARWLASVIILPTINIGTKYPGEAFIDARLILGMERMLEDFRIPFEQALNEVIIPRIEMNFASEGNPKWVRLAQSTVEKRGSAHPILVESGYLKMMAAQEMFWVVEKDVMWFNPSAFAAMVRYGQFHESGTRLMPARPFLSFDDTDIELVELIFTAYIAEVIGMMWGEYEI